VRRLRRSDARVSAAHANLLRSQHEYVIIRPGQQVHWSRLDRPNRSVPGFEIAGRALLASLFLVSGNDAVSLLLDSHLKDRPVRASVAADLESPVAARNATANSLELKYRASFSMDADPHVVQPAINTSV
jgi:hypothetical protein